MHAQLISITFFTKIENNSPEVHLELEMTQINIKKKE